MTTHEHINPDRLWILRAARGEIDTPAALDTVRAMHMAQGAT